MHLFLLRILVTVCIDFLEIQGNWIVINIYFFEDCKFYLVIEEVVGAMRMGVGS